VSDAPPPARPRGLWLAVVLLAAVLLGATFSRGLTAPSARSAAQPARPIVQIVRQQPGLPDLADLVDQLCPSTALLVPRGADPSAPGTTAAPAFAVSADGWLLTSASLPQGQLDAVFGDGRRVTVSEVRSDPVSGLAIAKSDGAASALTFSDQPLPRVGEFGLAVATPLGQGCSAEAEMVASDFLADGSTVSGYARIQSSSDDWAAGLPFVASDGRVLGMSIADPTGALIPAPTAASVVDQLIRDQLAPATDYGFQAIDYGPLLSARLGNVRSGAGVALVRKKSNAARAGLKAGDIVLAVDDVPVSSASELNRALDADTSQATLTVERGSEQLTLTVKRSQS